MYKTKVLRVAAQGIQQTITVITDGWTDKVNVKIQLIQFVKGRRQNSGRFGWCTLLLGGGGIVKKITFKYDQIFFRIMGS